MMGTHTMNLPFFVYGTLLPGQPNDHHWDDKITASEAATLRPAYLHDLSTFPMLVETPAADRPLPGPAVVHGRLIWLTGLSRPEYDRILAAVDALEEYDPADEDASLYRRVAREVETAGRQVTAWVYVGRPDVAHTYPLVPEGDWVAHCAAGKNMDSMARWWRDRGPDLLFGNFPQSE